MSSRASSAKGLGRHGIIEATHRPAAGRPARRHGSRHPHYSSIQFIHSAGAWDAASQRIAIATVTSGRPALAIFDAASGRKERESVIHEVDEIFNPTWAPDGHAICFTGMSRGLTDLYVYDLTTSTLRQLTHDAFADLQPAWSPDGRRIAFATDRFSSDLRLLDIGPSRLALIDLLTGTVEPVRAFTSGKHINPQWAPDGRSLLFISDRDGIPNLYRVTLDGSVAQLTTIATGLSGITATSPALSVATKTGVAAFSVYDDGKYNLVTLDTRIGASPPRELLSAAVLPPIDREPSAVAALLDDPAFGLPAPQAYEVTDYKPTLSLEYVGQPTIAIGADRFGAAVGGGMSFSFSDILGNHNLITAVQLNSGLSRRFSVKDTAAQVIYLNQTRRWNWGVLGGQMPFVTGGIQSRIDSLGGTLVQVDETILFRQTERSAAGVVAYPFNRSQRVEFQGGVSHMSFDQVVQSAVFSLNSGQLLDETTNETPIGRSLALATSSAALVYDSANFGPTSPVQGQRYRFEAAPAFGSVRFTSVLADFRRYFMPAPFYTFAARVIHYGRYGSGGQDERLFPLFLGYPNLVRGYDVNTFDSTECVATPVSDCPAFDRLVGSRVLVGNLEFRFPLLRPFGASQGMYSPVPVELALFADGGVAWDRNEKPSFLGGDRLGVSSVGVALRANLFGYAVAGLVVGNCRMAGWQDGRMAELQNCRIAELQKGLSSFLSVIL